MIQSGKIIDLRARAFMRRRVPRTIREPENPKRPASLRIRRRRKRALIAFFFVACVIFVIVFASQISYMPRFAIQHIEVSGAVVVDKDSIIQHINATLDGKSRLLFSRRNIFMYPQKEVESALVLDFPRIKSLSISRSTQSANSIVVRIIERTAYAKWCLGELKCYSMDDQGYVFATYVPSAEESLETPYVFYGNEGDDENIIGNFVIPDHFQNMIILMQLLDKEGFKSISAEIVGNDIHIKLDGFMIKKTLVQDPVQLMKNLQLVLSSEPLKGKGSQIEYIDLRFGNRVYYKMRGESADIKLHSASPSE